MSLGNRSVAPEAVRANQVFPTDADEDRTLVARDGIQRSNVYERPHLFKFPSYLLYVFAIKELSCAKVVYTVDGMKD